MTDGAPPDRALIEAHLGRVLSSESFRRAERSSALLRYLVDAAVDGQGDRLKEYTVGVEALGRGDSFDPRTDPIVRAEASRLRARLDRYYEAEGRDDALVFQLPKGSYVPRVVRRAAAEGAAAEGAAAGTAERPTRTSFGLRRLAWAGLMGAIAVAAIAAALWSGRSPSGSMDRPLVQFEDELKIDGVLGSEVGTDMVLSPDGTRLVFVSHSADGVAHLNTRRLDQPDVIQLPETDGARVPFFSPDGRWVAFLASGKLKKVAVDGGAPVVLGEATDLLGGSWEDDNTIIAALNPTSRLWRLPAAGGTPEVVLDLSAESRIPAWPQVLPGGRYVIYTVLGGMGADRADIEVRAIDGGERKVLVRGGTFGRYLPNGYLTYVNQGTLYALPFDAERLTTGGAPVPVLDDVSYSRTFGYAQMDVSRTGTLVYRKGAESAPFAVEWLDRSGASETLVSRPGRYGWPRLSPDGTRLAYSAVEGGTAGIWIHDTRRNEAIPITSTDTFNAPIWWGDGDILLLGGHTGMGWIHVDRPDTLHRLTTSRTVQIPWSYTPDHKRLAYYQMDPVTGFDLWTVPVKAGKGGLEFGDPEPLLRTPAFECYPSFSPDGRWLAYTSNETGAWEVYVKAVPDNGTRVRVSVSGGLVPKWSADGRELLYRTADHRVMAVSYTVMDGAFVASAPEVWPTRSLGDAGVLPNYDVDPASDRIVALTQTTRPEDQQSRNHVTFLLNFADEVGRRTAAAGRTAVAR